MWKRVDYSVASSFPLLDEIFWKVGNFVTVLESRLLKYPIRKTHFFPSKKIVQMPC